MTFTNFRESITELDARIDLVRKFWTRTVPDVACPSDQQLALWLSCHSLDVLLYGLKTTGRKAARLSFLGTPMDENYAIRYMSSVMNKATYPRETTTPSEFAPRYQVNAA